MKKAESQVVSLSQRELRNESGRVLRAVGEGRSFVVTDNGTPVAYRSARRTRARAEDRSSGAAAGRVVVFEDRPENWLFVFEGVVGGTYRFG